MTADQKRAVSVSIIEFRNMQKHLKIGDSWTVGFVVRDVCKKCGNEQVVRLEKSRGRAVFNASHLLMPQNKLS